jgi:hypothetical protein
MATATTSYSDKTQAATELVGGHASRHPNGGFLILAESNFDNLPAGACVCIASVSFSRLQAGDYILVAGEGKVVARRFIKLSTSDGVTRLLVTDGREQQSISLSRLMGLITGVKTEGRPYNPNPQGFLQRTAFKLRYTFGRIA